LDSYLIPHPEIISIWVEEEMRYLF
jgi:hypothetical protein